MSALREIGSAALEAITDRDTWEEGIAITAAFIASFVLIAIFATAPL